MIVKILSSTGTFAGVQYNTNKVEGGKGMLMKVMNMPHVDGLNISPKECIDYFKAHSSSNKRIKNAQFHAMISGKGNELNEYQLSEIAEKYMKEMGYENNPYIIVFHNDTDNNHVHIVSSRIDNQGKKIPHFREGIRSRKIIDALEKEYNVERKKDLDPYLSYSFQTKNQLITLLKSQGFQVESKNGTIDITYGGTIKKSINEADLKLKEWDKKRAKQISSLIDKYSKIYNTYLFPIQQNLPGKRVGDKIIGYRSDFSDFMKSKFGIEFVYHFSDNKKPYGFTVIDHKDKTIFKGSEIYKLNQLVRLTEPTDIKKDRILKLLNGYNIQSLDHLKLIAKYYKVEEHKLTLNNRSVSKDDAIYYKILLDNHFSNNDWDGLNRFNIVPITHNNTLYLMDKSNLTIIEASACLDQEIINSYISGHNVSDDMETRLSAQTDLIWNISDDVDDEMVHGRKRNKKKSRI